MSIKKLYAEIAKVEDEADGTLKVYGYASTDSEDSDGETITADAMKAALPGYMKWGAVREMHQAKAAGTAIEAKVQDDGRTWFGAHIVDAEAVKKIKANVYKGLSIGGRITDRDEMNKSVITGLNLVEVSLVDRPANPECVLTMYKAESLEEKEPKTPAAIDELAAILNKGEVTPEQLVEFAKSLKPAPTESEKKEDLLDIKKWSGEEICDASTALNALDAIYYLLSKELDEADSAEQVANLKAVVDNLKAYIVSELQEETMSGTEGDAMAMAAKPGDVAKTEVVDPLAKLQSELDVLKADVSKLTGERDDLAKRVKELEALPKAGGALLKAIAKGEDVQPIVAKPEISPVLKHDGTVDETATAIKKIQQAPATHFFR